MRIGVTYDLKSDHLARGISPEDAAEFDCEDTIAAICAALAAQGWEVARIGPVQSLIQHLAAGECYDAVFNFCEGLNGVAREAQVPALLEVYDIPYVFSDALTMALALDKALAKRVLRDCAVPTADFALIETSDDVAAISLPFPLFLKPVAEGSGKGIHAHSRVEDAGALRATALALLAQFHQPVLVETFLPGREFTVGLIGTGKTARVLGISEIVPKANYVGHGYGFENKHAWEDKVAIVPASDAAAQAAGEVALAAWRALRCRDGGRIDVREDAQGRPNVIELNPLAGLRPDYSDLCFIAKFQGLTYQDLIDAIMQAFLQRHPQLHPRG